VAVVETKSDQLDEAMAAAWSAFAPALTAPATFVQAGPARRGWESTRSYEYGHPGDPMRIFSKTFRKGDDLTMVLVRADQGVWDRRRGQAYLVLDSMRPRGYVPESFAEKRANPLDAARLDRITNFVGHSVESAGIPGAALALVQNGRIVFEGGFGVRELGKPAKVDANTLFMIGSCSKALTTLLMGKLVDEGKFGWETPVTAVYPGFRLGDDATTARLRMKHLVCACTGLPREGFESILEYARTTAKDKIDYVARMKPVTKLGEAYQYSNILGSVAGFIAGSAAYPGQEPSAAYDQAIRSRVFEPLGMSRTTVDLARVEKSARAMPHSENFDGQPAVVTGDFNRAVSKEVPSGGIWSTAHDMAAYLQMELAGGTLPDGKRYIEEGTLLARRVPQVSTGENRAYAMGLMVDTRWGVQVVNHGGSTFGYRATMFMLPTHDLGAILLTNADAGGELAVPVLRKIMEVAFDGAPEADEDVELRIQQRQKRLAQDRARSTFPAAQREVAKLAHRYAHPTLGEIAVITTPKGTTFDFGEWKSAVASCGGDGSPPSFRLVDPGAPDMIELFAEQREGKRVLVMRDMQGEQVFRESPRSPLRH
jgi:CubicO group peptidase (beta-lactamase class C family)